MRCAGYSPLFVAWLLIVVLTPTAWGSSVDLTPLIGTVRLLASIANNTATNADNGPSLHSVSTKDKASALSTLNGFRRQAGASNMNNVVSTHAQFLYTFVLFSSGCVIKQMNSNESCIADLYGVSGN